jgi:hypothetical protein
LRSKFQNKSIEVDLKNRPTEMQKLQEKSEKNRKHEEIPTKIKGGEKLTFQLILFKPVIYIPITQDKV